ncbi:MAG: glycine cleavage system protein GcvH [Deltaproteobacteria bacterium]|nr:glycine cleavage system protein GcvH [Deltaproteobacteria bacterium]
MSNVPADLKYTEEHEWVRTEGDVVVVGITDHAQGSLGDVVFLDLPEVGRQLTRGKAFGVVESVKAVSDLYAPVDGEVVAVNSELVNAPEQVNKEPYGAAWMLKVKPKSAADVAGLLDAAGYAALLAKIAK